MNSRHSALLWAAQRISAAVLALFVVVHLATMIYAVQGGLTAEEILGRTRDSVVLLLFYCGFVVSVAIHAPIGLRNILMEHFGWRGPSLTMAMGFVGFLLLVLGFRAAWGVFS